MQGHDYGTVDWLYILFCIMFILTGLTIVASSGNLLILRFVETNTKRSQHERYEMEEKRRQKVRVIGDVISSNGQFLTLEDNEESSSLYSPIGARRSTLKQSTSNFSFCSCRDQTLCLPIVCKKRFKRKKETKNSRQSNYNQRTLQEEILHALQTKTEVDENIALQRSYLQLDKIQKRTSI